MTNTPDGLSVLCERLRSERLLVTSELENLQRLNEQVDLELNDLALIAWTSRQEQLVLSRLINSHPSVVPENSCRQMALLNRARCVEGYRRVGAQHSTLTEILNALLRAPVVVAELLNAADHLGAKPDALISCEEITLCVYSLLYGCCAYPQDEKLVLEVLAHLMRVQLAVHNNPRLVLRKGRTAFSRLYRVFAEGLFTAKIFLTAALHDSVMFLLSQDEQYLDVDPSKCLIRFPAEERRRRFGEESSPNYARAVEAHRRFILQKLVKISLRFIQGICQAISCFPPSLTWLVRQLHTVLVSSKRVNENEATLICTDLIFTYFLCPAITNPEPLGIIADTPISHVARFNLMQVGQILQTLALAPFEQPQPQFAPLYEQFDQSMARVVTTVLESDTLSLDSMFPSVVSDTRGVELFARRIFLGTLADLNVMQNWVRTTTIDAPSASAAAASGGAPNAANVEHRRQLRVLARRLPATLVELSPGGRQANVEGMANEARSGTGRTGGGQRLRNFADRVQTAASRGHRFLQQQGGVGETTLTPALNGRRDPGTKRGVLGEDRDESLEDEIAELLMFPLGESREPLGLDAEEKFMESLRVPASRKHKETDGGGCGEKRTRFVDSESIATSDRTEACSEEGSLSSSLDGMTNGDAEDVSTLPDNFSDVVPISANVSGRGSPSISGRETPLSVHAEQPDAPEEEYPLSSKCGLSADPAARRDLPALPVTVQKENPEGLEEKFGKFGLPQEQTPRYRDDTHSLVSDSWSTDVVPSDNEGGVGDRAESTSATATGGVSNLQQIAMSAPPGGAGGDVQGAPPDPGHGPPGGALMRHSSGGSRGGGGGVVGGQQVTQAALGAGVLMMEDRSDTWSVDAIASDSETDTANRQEDMLMIDDTASEPGVGEDTVSENMSRQDGDEQEAPLSAESNDAVTNHLPDVPIPTPPTFSPNVLLTQAQAAGHFPIVSTPSRSSTDAAAVGVFNAGSITGGNIGNGGEPERLRRQSSGSSFYSKSDVDSEFSKDLNDDALSSLLGDYTPSFRHSVGEISASSAIAGLQLQAAREAGAATSCAQLLPEEPMDTTAASAIGTGEQVQVMDGSATGGAKNPVRTTTASASQQQAQWKASGAMPKGTPGAFNTHRPLTQRGSAGARITDSMSSARGGNAQTTTSPSAGGNSRKKINIFQGLQKVGEKMRKGASSTIRQSFTVNDIASTPLDPLIASSERGANAITRDAAGNTVNMLASRSTSHLVELGRNATEEQTADDILNKYRNHGKAKTQQQNSTTTLITVNNYSTGFNNNNTIGSGESAGDSRRVVPVSSITSSQPAEPYYSAENLSQCRAFADAKRKLRLVLSSVGSLPTAASSAMHHRQNHNHGSERRRAESAGGGGGGDNLSVNDERHRQRSRDDKDSSHLIQFLQLLLAESINGQEKTLSAQIREVLRCLAAFDSRGIRKLLRTLKDEHRKRTAYLLYLQQSRLILLQLRSYLEKLASRIHREKSLCGECLVEVLVRFEMEKCDRELRRFVAEFRTLNAQDEKTDMVERVLADLCERLPSEAMWQHADAERLQYARKSLERSIMAHIYSWALFPNGDADICRDELFYKSLQKLAQQITPDHPELAIPKRFHGECPWPSAQAEIAILNAYKSPRDKMACVLRCCETIENLIVLTAERATATADDITPVLVFVLIQANPPALLSNIQYIQGFYGNRMEGAEAYWWAQFTSAVEFIKTMLNRS